MTFSGCRRGAGPEPGHRGVFQTARAREDTGDPTHIKFMKIKFSIFRFFGPIFRTDFSTPSPPPGFRALWLVTRAEESLDFDHVVPGEQLELWESPQH